METSLEEETIDFLEMVDKQDALVTTEQIGFVYVGSVKPGEEQEETPVEQPSSPKDIDDGFEDVEEDTNETTDSPDTWFRLSPTGQHIERITRTPHTPYRRSYRFFSSHREEPDRS